jgi:anti-anti-sigma factor
LTRPTARRIVRTSLGRAQSGEAVAMLQGGAAVRGVSRMSVQNWSESIILAELSDDPQYTEDMAAVIEQCEKNPRLDALLSFAEVRYLNSSNIARLLKLRKLVELTNERRLVLCSVNRQVWGVFLVTGLDRIFECVDDVATGLAALQIESA